MTPLHMACITHDGRPAALRALLAYGADPTVRAGAAGAPMLHFVRNKGAAAIIPLLLAAGLDIDAADNQGRTALHRVVHNCDTDAAMALIEAGARLDAADNQKGDTPLRIAARHGPACHYPLENAALRACLGEKH
jgi:ankyrin repeat protein